MKEIPLDQSATIEIQPEERHMASSLGNTGVHVVSTPALIGFLELASHKILDACCEPGEVSVGTRVEVDHLAAAFVGQPIQASARLVAAEGRRITFAVEARQGDRLVMQGRHGRAVVNLERLLARRSRV